MAHTAVEITDEPTAVYRLYDSGGTLLYVGITNSLPVRFAQHAAEKSWWPQVAQKTAVLYGSRTEAEKAELTAIRTESPVHNIAGRGPSRQPKYKLPPVLRKPPAAPGRPVAARKPAAEVVFAPDAAILSWIESYAEEKKCSRAKAFAELVFMGRMQAYQEDLAAIEAERAELEKVIAARTVSVAP